MSAPDPGDSGGEPDGPQAAAGGRWLALGLPMAFLPLVGGWVWFEVPAAWRAGHPGRAAVGALIAAAALYAWSRFMLQIWRGWRAAGEPPPRLPPP